MHARLGCYLLLSGFLEVVIKAIPRSFRNFSLAQGRLLMLGILLLKGEFCMISSQGRTFRTLSKLMIRIKGSVEYIEL